MPQPKSTTTKALTEIEKGLLRESCSLKAAEFDVKVPEYYGAEWCKASRKKDQCRRWLTHFIDRNAKDIQAASPTTIIPPVFVSDDMVTDIQVLNFCRGGDTT